MKILIDAFGGDNSPQEVIAGTVAAVKARKGFTAVLVGNKEVLDVHISRYGYPQDRIEILDAKQVITCDEEPTVGVRTKPDSTICKAFKELKDNEDAKAFVSAGSTGAVLVGATLKLGRIKDVARPALCPVIPRLDGKNVFLMDSGANADCKAINLCQFAVMGTVYAKAMGVENPKVALLSNGTEDEKGNALNHEVFPMLKSMKGINFIGNMEARDILSGEADVVIADGFAGNVALKSMEGAVKTVLYGVKDAIKGSLFGRIGGLFLKKRLNKLKNKLDYSKKGGALFIGVNKPVIKAHGSAGKETFKNAILQAVDYAEFDLADKITAALEDSGAANAK
ncbi:MAG: phosphate acyltransferase PlsX [Clostridia bacterium]|nr:phosphate acyltransferase PlsX [Clostridia bacterium]